MTSKENMLSQLKKKRLFIFIIISIAYMFTPFQRVAPAIMGPDLMKELKLNAVDWGLLGLTFTWTFAVANLFIGALIDKFGPRRSLSIALILTSLGCSMFAVAHSFAWILIGRMIVAIAVSAFLICGAKIISSWYSTKEFSGMYGLFMGLGALGGVFATVPLQYMMTNYGWRQSFINIAIVGVILGAISLTIKDRPSDVGLSTPDELAGEVVAKAQTKAPVVALRTSLKEVVTKPHTWILAFFMLGINASSQSIGALWGGVFLADVYGLSKPVIANILGFAAIGTVLGAVLGGWLVKIIGVTRVMVSGALIFLVTWLYMTINIRALSVTELQVIQGIIGFVQMYCIVAGFSLLKDVELSCIYWNRYGIN